MQKIENQTDLPVHYHIVQQTPENCRESRRSAKYGLFAKRGRKILEELNGH